MLFHYSKSKIACAIALSTSGLALSNSVFANDTSIVKIIVTGQKIERTLQDTPASVAVISSTLIEEQNLNDFYDVLDRTPNVSVQESGSFTIRGIDSFNVSGAGAGSLASVYIDGSPLPYRMIQQGGFSTWDVSHVEVLRGPQSTLQGRNALAGAVVMKTRDATQEYSAKARVGFGEFGAKELAIALGGALIEDELSFRLSGEKNEFGGYNTNVATGERSDYSESEFYRAKLRYTPSSLPEFEANLSYMHSKNDMGVNWVATESSDEAYAINDIYEDRYVFLDSPTFEATNTDMYVLNMEYDLTDDWFINSITTYADSYYGYEWDGDASIGDVKSTLIDDRTDKTTTQELRFIYEGDALSGLIGMYYSHVDVEDISGGEQGLTLERLGLRTILTAPAEYGGLGLPEATADQVMGIYAPADPVYLDRFNDHTSAISTAAIFADFTYEINARWDVFAGIRYNQETQENSSIAEVGISERTNLPNPDDYAANATYFALISGLNQQLNVMAAEASAVEPLTDTSFNAWLPKVGATYKVTPDVSTSFTVQKGFRSGGVGTNTAQAKTFTFDPEFTWNYEWSLRSTWLDDTLVVNANVFYLDWTDQQVSVSLSGNQYDKETRNAGSSHVQGIETEFTYALAKGVSVYGGIGYAKTEFDKFEVDLNGETKDYSGREFMGAPKWTGLIGLNYAQGDGFVANISANHQGSSQRLSTPTTDGYDPRNDAYTLVNTRVGYEWGNYGVFGLVENLLDANYIARAKGQPDYHNLSKPRTLSVRFEAAF